MQTQKNGTTGTGPTTLWERRSIWTARYWREAAVQLKVPRLLIFAALIVALRVAVKGLKLPLAANLSLTFDCYVNSLGSLVYGPVVALLVGAVSDTLGCIFFPTGPYFLPFILVEMSSSFLFALFFWRQRLDTWRVLIAKFTVNLVCNIFLTSLFVKWSTYVFSGPEAAEAYNLITLVRIGKNLVLFPLESVLILLVFNAFVPVLRRLGVLPSSQKRMLLSYQELIVIVCLFLFSIALILFYIFFLREFLSEHNIKLLSHISEIFPC